MLSQYGFDFESPKLGIPHQDKEKVCARFWPTTGAKDFWISWEYLQNTATIRVYGGLTPQEFLRNGRAVEDRVDLVMLRCVIEFQRPGKLMYIYITLQPLHQSFFAQF